LTSHVPVRTCVGCRVRRPKSDLVRFVCGRKGITIGAADGRGTYLCRNTSCLEKALRRKCLMGRAGSAPGEEALAALRRLVAGADSSRHEVGSGQADCRASGGGLIG
jgi:predicted RNA-binding protein YlxR (DUF448 family)